MVKQELSCWRDFHNFWIHKAKVEGVPVFFFRFEDITRSPKDILMQVFAFSLDRPSVEGTLVESKIDLLMKKKAEGTANTQLYKPRDASVSNKNLYRFSQEQLDWITAELSPLLDFFSYNANETAFFPAVPVTQEPKFHQLNDQVRQRTLATSEQSDQSATTSVPINHDVNIRGASHTESRDLPDG